MELHTRQTQGFFDIPVDHMEPLPVLAKHFEKKGFSQNENVVVVAPDIGSLKRARGFAKWLEVPLAIVEKRKNENGKYEVENLIGDVRGKKVILLDDMINTGKTVCNAADALIKNGATEVYCCATHAVFSENAVEASIFVNPRDLISSFSFTPAFLLFFFPKIHFFCTK